MRNKLSAWAFSLSVIGVVIDLFIHMTFFTYLAEVMIVAGFICGVIALRQIKRTGESGRGLAWTGVVIGVVAMLIVAVSLVIVYVYGTPIGS